MDSINQSLLGNQTLGESLSDEVAKRVLDRVNGIDWDNMANESYASWEATQSERTSQGQKPE